MIKIGITGGIGSGKSVVAALFRLLGVPVYIADTESKRLVGEHPVIRERLLALLGPETYTCEGLNRAYMASRIFADPALLTAVNGIIHPVVNRHFLDWAAGQTAPLVALESAILFESGFDSVVDVSLMVYAPEEIRIRRAMAREGVSRERVLERLRNQLDDEVKKERADYVVYNDDCRALLPQVTEFLRLVSAGAGTLV
ncbi:MAG: dephospho-CoA kinase [Parabacteroides sp.]|nr:dephospho-CoA kinase [Parabacteroides sp.]